MSEMYNFLQDDSTKCAPEYELSSFATMVIYWVPDLPNIKGITDFHGHVMFTSFQYGGRFCGLSPRK